ncbi:hypothetical protein CORC01_05306 [Colletotrichum orchidophilum]|uniref:SH3 domain-containing protein n=1 Tax=Colletotrichum orchidophilum TaxID=1209926 RepID=A0A1G4BDS7_9PEZI|nr:uncharacterized protein CORC01_05306 [Colletotrichum orchidophilum]OHE99506.1 hypothetical protein CORC01_05306 [Colletotrichum orchidophilum]
MAVDVEELILYPFREVVERGEESAKNAHEAHEEEPELAREMAKSASAITKEGQRALKRLQPLWDSQIEKHGDNFKDTIADNNDLAEKRKALEELLYDFEDYIEVDTFDLTKFVELQAATRSFALVVLDAIQRTKIDTKTPPAPVHKFPPLPPLPPSLASSIKSNPPPRPAPPPRVASHGAASISLFPAVPRQPKPQVSRGNTRGSYGSTDSTTTRLTHSRAESTESDPRSSRVVPGSIPSNRDGRPRPLSPDALGDEMGRLRVVTPQERVQPWTSDWVEEQTSVPKPRRPVRGSIPENTAVVGDAFCDGTFIARGNRIGFDNSTPQSSVFDPISPSTTSRTSVYSDVPTQSSSVTSTKISTVDARMSPIAATRFEQALTTTFPPSGQFADGLMLASEQAVSETSTHRLRSISTLEKEEGCLIGPKSSFHQLKGFCDGALSFRRGGYWDGIKQTMAWGEPLLIGRCIDCEYHHLHKALALDKEGDSRANFSKYGIVYRVRFLVKSHIAVKTASETRYACLFCTHFGQTVHEADATVFQSADQLLKHVSSHPQPLPQVPGVTVLYGQVDKDHDPIEDYDVHFPSSPAPSPFPDHDILAQFPVATALKSYVQRKGENLVGPDGSPNVLQFFVGARIVGVEFPEQWGGKWCTGWHDGVQGPFPSKLVEIESPRQNEISFQATSAVSLTTRWKWDPPDNSRAGWLTFGKGEAIRNVGWLYQDHWCWSGTNSKGKFGIFPQSHVSPQSLKEGSLPPSIKRPQTSGPMRIFSRRRKSTSTASSMSGDP